MESGQVRVRKYFDTPLDLTDFEWAFTDDEYEEFKAFFEDELLHGQYAFIITILDPDDSEQEIVEEYGFYEANYQWAYTNGVFLVRAAMVLEETAIEVLAEPFNPGLCGVVIWPAVSDGEGGGNTFECYTAGAFYITSGMMPAGTGIAVIYLGNSPFAVFSELFETFAAGDLVLGSPSAESMLTQMYYGDSPLNNVMGETWESFAADASLADGTSSTGSGLGSFFTGEGPP